MNVPKIFVSHSAITGAGARVLNDVCRALTDSRFEVLVDRIRLPSAVGDQWRDALNTWMELCHAAIVIVDDSAKMSLGEAGARYPDLASEPRSAIQIVSGRRTPGHIRRSAWGRFRRDRDRGNRSSIFGSRLFAVAFETLRAASDQPTAGKQHRSYRKPTFGLARQGRQHTHDPGYVDTYGRGSGFVVSRRDIASRDCAPTPWNRTAPGHTSTFRLGAEYRGLTADIFGVGYRLGGLQSGGGRPPHRKRPDAGARHRDQRLGYGAAPLVHPTGQRLLSHMVCWRSRSVRARIARRAW